MENTLTEKQHEFISKGLTFKSFKYYEIHGYTEWTPFPGLFEKKYIDA